MTKRRSRGETEDGSGNKDEGRDEEEEEEERPHNNEKGGRGEKDDRCPTGV